MPKGQFHRYRLDSAAEQMYCAYRGYIDNTGKYIGIAAMKGGVTPIPFRPVELSGLSTVSVEGLWLAREQIYAYALTRGHEFLRKNVRWTEKSWLFRGDYMNMHALRELMRDTAQGQTLPTWAVGRDLSMKSLSKGDVASLVDICFECGKDYRDAIVKTWTTGDDLFIHVGWAYKELFGVGVDLGYTYPEPVEGEELWPTQWIRQVHVEEGKAEQGHSELLPRKLQHPPPPLPPVAKKEMGALMGALAAGF